MNTNKKIKSFLNRFTSKDCEENIHKPTIKVSKTVRPDQVYSFNEVSQHINKQLR